MARRAWLSQQRSGYLLAPPRRAGEQWAVRWNNQLNRLWYGFISHRRKAYPLTIQIDWNCFFRMHLQPGRLPIGDVLAIGWKLLQFSRRGEQRRWRDLTNDKHIEQTVVDACARSDLDTAAGLAAIPNDCHRP